MHCRYNDQDSQFIHYGYFHSASSSPLLLRDVPGYSIETVSEFHTEALQATASEELAQGPYVAARREFEPATLQTQGTVLTNVPHRPTIVEAVKLRVEASRKRIREQADGDCEYRGKWIFQFFRSGRLSQDLYPLTYLLACSAFYSPLDPIH